MSPYIGWKQSCKALGILLLLLSSPIQTYCTSLSAETVRLLVYQSTKTVIHINTKAVFPVISNQLNHCHIKKKICCRPQPLYICYYFIALDL